MPTLTDHMLREALEGVSKTLNNGSVVYGASASSGNTENQVVLSIDEKTVIKADTKYLYSGDGSKIRLVSPIPSVYWKCTAQPDKNGVMTLQLPVSVLALTLGETSVCLGFTGATDEFELWCRVGENEIRINTNFLQLKSEHLVRNGVEVN